MKSKKMVQGLSETFCSRSFWQAVQSCLRVLSCLFSFILFFFFLSSTLCSCVCVLVGAYVWFSRSGDSPVAGYAVRRGVGGVPPGASGCCVHQEQVGLLGIFLCMKNFLSFHSSFVLRFLTSPPPPLSLSLTHSLTHSIYLSIRKCPSSKFLWRIETEHKARVCRPRVLCEVSIRHRN